MLRRTASDSPDEAAALHDQLAPVFTAIFGGGLPDDPAGLEQLAATLLVPLELADLPAEVPAALVGEIEREATAGAAALLEAVAVLAGDVLAAQSRAAIDRLGAAGVVSPLAGRLGTLRVREATRSTSDDGDLLVAHLRRPSSRRTQLALLGIDRAETGALASCLLTPPMSAAGARRVMDSMQRDGATAAPQPIAVGELVASVRAAAQRSVEVGVPLDADSAVALPQIARALTGDPQGLPRPAAMAPWEDDDPDLIVDAAEDEDGFRALMEQLLDEFEQHATSVHPRASPVWHGGDFVASCMLEWKGGYGDGCLGRWTTGDLADFLLDHFPRKVTATQETLDAVPACVLAFLDFLDARGSLSGDPLDELEEACLSLTEPFLESVEDPTSWGLAKSMAMEMLAEGVDLDDPRALEAWTAGFNARPAHERDLIVGGPADRTLEAARAPGPAARGGSPPPKRAKQRKAQRAARKRNRPRR